MDESKPIVVLASGAFDLVHYGHVRFLEEAKKAGGKDARLVVIVARDKTVERLKGGRPVIPEDQRRGVVEALKPVDEAILGFEDINLMDTIERIKPDVIAVGHDQEEIARAVRRIIAERGLKIKVVKIGRFGQTDLDSSSKIKRRIIKELRREASDR
ncbi:MAG: adenylyltransferase/cytidyltransferase family protein [Candidatus Bathyarchaeia archaeon]